VAWGGSRRFLIRLLYGLYGLLGFIWLIHLVAFGGHVLVALNSFEGCHFSGAPRSFLCVQKFCPSGLLFSPYFEAPTLQIFLVRHFSATWGIGLPLGAKSGEPLLWQDSFIRLQRSSYSGRPSWAVTHAQSLLIVRLFASQFQGLHITDFQAKPFFGIVRRGPGCWQAHYDATIVARPSYRAPKFGLL